MNNVPSSGCYVLRSCTPGNTTVIITNTVASPSLSPSNIGQHVLLENYPEVCFSVELSTSGCVDCSNPVTVTLIKPNPICSCTTLIRYFLLEPCNELLPSFYTQQNLYPYDGTTITFFGQGGTCYNVIGVLAGAPPSNLSAITVDCPEPCNCSDQPDAWEITFCDSTGLDPIITSTDLDQYIGAVDTAVFIISYTDGGNTISGCGSVTKTLAQVAPTFTGTFSTIFYDCCEKCTQVCYLLEDCQGAVDPIITCTDLSNYVNQIVKLSNCGDICWKVSESNTCDDSILLGTVIENFVPEPVVKNNCVYEVSLDSSIVTFSSYEITINNTFYIIDYTNITALVNDLNSLNLGVFYFSGGYIGVNGLENYGTSCLVRTPKPKICTEPTCSTYTDPQDLDFAQACTDCLPPLPPEPVLDLHLRRIKPGYFSPNSCITTEYMDRINCNFAKQVYDAMLIKRYGITVCCDHDVDAWDIKKQGLDFELLTDPNLCKSTLCVCPAPCLVDVIFTLLPICVAPILVEATLDTLCYPAVLVDATITLETTPASCNCYTLEGSNYTIGWIDCCCIYQSAAYTANAIVCAQYTPVILDGTVTITAAADCGSELCVVPPPACLCWGISVLNKAPSTTTYTNCDNIEITVNAFYGDSFEVCSPNSPITTNGTIATNGPCNIDCGSGLCICYQVLVTSNDSNPATIDLRTRTCDFPFVFVNTTITSGTPFLTCSSSFPEVLSADPNAVINIVVSSGVDCVDCQVPVPCVDCYEIVTTAPTTQINWINCDGISMNQTSDPGIYRICSLTIPTTDPIVTPILAPFDCDSGLCVTPCVAGDPPSCYTITVTSLTAASLNIASCANGNSNVSTFYGNLTLGTVITTCAQNSIATPIITGGTATILNNGPCTVACLDPAPVCICYRVSVQPGFTGTIDFGWIDCDGIFQTDTAISGNAPIAVCSQSAITFISFTGGAGILSVVASTDDCSLGQCI
jgi:hypothetical protein